MYVCVFCEFHCMARIMVSTVPRILRPGASLQGLSIVHLQNLTAQYPFGLGFGFGRFAGRFLGIQYSRLRSSVVHGPSGEEAYW